jgi:hypothetical protein
MVVVRMSVVALAFALFLSLASAQQPGTAKAEPALDVTAMDRSTDLCVDFFAYSCGGWIKRSPIPPDQSSWDTYSKMQDENLSQLRGILEEASAPEDRGLLCFLHRREGDRREWSETAWAVARTDRKDRFQGRNRRRSRGHD